MLVSQTRQLEARLRSREAWVPVDDIVDALHDRTEDFLLDRSLAERSSYGYSSYYHGSPYTAYNINDLNWVWEDFANNEEAGWSAVEQIFIQAVLTEGLFWLGLVELGYARPVTPEGGKPPPGLLAVRLNEMGRWLLLKEAEPAIPEESGRVVVQPNFRIFAFDPIADSVLARLDSFAIRLNAARAIEYEITRESIYRSQLGGQSTDQIIAWLEQVTGAGLPQNVARSLTEWKTAFERIAVRTRAGWLEVASPELAERLLAEPRLAAAIVRRVTPTGFIVHPDQVDALEQELLAAGELPGRTSSAEAARRASIRVETDGRIQFAHAVPNLHVQGYLQPFADLTPGGWRITPASIGRARAAGKDATAVLAELEAMALGGVPPEVQSRIKMWSGHFGSVLLQPLILAQFRDQDALDELRRDPELARLLTPLKPEARLGLATIATPDLERARSLLVEHGVELR
jgi:hypothetical protein